MAIPAAPPDIVADLAQEADLIVCLSQPGRFHAPGYRYHSFPQLTDDEVTDALVEARLEYGAGSEQFGHGRSSPARPELLPVNLEQACRLVGTWSAWA